MDIIKSIFIERLTRTFGIESFRFAPEEKIAFLPGQFLQLIFDREHLENKELNKYLSFSSSPTKEYWEVTKRLSNSIFSERLRNLKSGEEVILRAPLGNCVFHDDYSKIGFVVGGIGVTPVISVLEYIENKDLSTDVVIFYANRDDRIAFKQELDRWQEELSNMKVFYVVSQGSYETGSYIKGHINRELLESKVDDWLERVVFAFGPPKMVEEMRNLFLSLGMRKESIMIESFLGY